MVLWVNTVKKLLLKKSYENLVRKGESVVFELTPLPLSEVETTPYVAAKDTGLPLPPISGQRAFFPRKRRI